MSGQHAFEQRLERLGGRPLERFTIVNFLRTIGCKALVIHDRDDWDVSFQSAEEITTNVDAAELRDFRGLGHRNILLASPVARTIASYLTPPAE